MDVPLLDLKAQFKQIRDEINRVIAEVVESQEFILGPKVEDLEKAVAAYSGTSHAIGVSSGTDALLVAMMALGIGPGDEVITTPFSFFATAGLIPRLGATPVFADIEPNTFNIDAPRVYRAITKRTKAILPVHLFGQCADMDPILEMANDRDLPVIEDAAQSIGAEYGEGGKRAGSLGTIGAFSFFPSKNLGCFGDGGMVTTHDAGLAEKIRALRHHGAKRAYDHQMVGGNFRLDALQAAVLGVKLEYLDRWSEARRENAKYYDRRLNEEGLVDNGHVQTPPAIYARGGDKNYPIYNQYTLRVKDRDALKAHFAASGIGCSVYYPIPLHLQACFIGLGHRAGSFPASERAAEEALSIPVYPELTFEQKEYVVQTLVSFYRGRRRTEEAEGGR